MVVRPSFSSFHTEPAEEAAVDEVPEPVAEVKPEPIVEVKPEPVAEVKPEPVKVVKPELTILEKILKVENLQLIIEKRAKLVQTRSELERRGWLLGGEGSGHLLALDKHSTGDGLISALQVLQACVRSGQTVVQLLAGVTLFPQTLINVRLQPGQEWKSNTHFCNATQTVEAELGDTGRVLIRASGTEPLLRVMVEARDAVVARSSAQRIAKTLELQ